MTYLKKQMVKNAVITLFVFTAPLFLVVRGKPLLTPFWVYLVLYVILNVVLAIATFLVKRYVNSSNKQDTQDT